MGRAATMAAVAAAAALGGAEARQLHEQVALAAGVSRELATHMGELGGRDLQGIEVIQNAVLSCMDAYNIGTQMRCLNTAVVGGIGTEPLSSLTDSENGPAGPSEESMAQMVSEGTIGAIEALALDNNTATVEQCELAFTPLLPRCMYHIGTDAAFEQNIGNFFTALTTGFADAGASCEVLKAMIELNTGNLTLPGSPEEFCEMASDNGGENGENGEIETGKREGEGEGGASEGEGGDDDIAESLAEVVLAGTACNAVSPGITDVEAASTSSPTSSPTVNSASVAQTGFLALFAGIVAAFA